MLKIKMDRASDNTIIYGLNLFFSFCNPDPRMTGSKVKEQGVRIVNTPARNDISKSAILFD